MAGTWNCPSRESALERWGSPFERLKQFVRFPLLEVENKLALSEELDGCPQLWKEQIEGQVDTPIDFQDLFSAH
jgi:hypothetical protein